MPTVINFENVLSTNPSNFDIDAKVTMVEGPSTLDYSEGPVPNAIQVDQSTTFTFKWNLTGFLAGPLFATGNLKIDVFYELVGGGALVSVPQTTVTLSPTKLTGPTATVDVVVAPLAVTEGVYRIVIRLAAFLAGGTATPVCGFTELGLIQYYKG